MQVFKAHKWTTFFLSLYLLWWSFVIYFSAVNPPGPHGYINLIIYLLTVAIAGAYTLVLIIEMFRAKEENRTDYFIFLGLVTFPLLLAFIYMSSNL